MFLRAIVTSLLAFPLSALPLSAGDQDDQHTLRVFIFAGQSNMVGSDSRVADIQRFPPFDGLQQPQTEVLFSYCLGRENKTRSDGWVDLQPVNGVVGPELSFAREVSRHIEAPIAIIKCAAGGTHLGGDWNPDQPSGFEMYPLALNQIRSSLAELDRKNIKYRLEGFMWHQGENDMFNADYLANYGKNLKNFLHCWRRDLQAPQLRFYIGELCTKTIWGMDLRPRMDGISKGQTAVAQADPHAEYVPTSHVGVEIGGGVGLHYHYGTLGQLEHGVNYAHAYLQSLGQELRTPRALRDWPYHPGSAVKLFVLAGHRNMEGERAFVSELARLPGGAELLADNHTVAFRYDVAGGYLKSNGWEPLGPAGLYETFGPELSFARTLQSNSPDNIAIAKFTHSGTQIIDWTPAGSIAKSRNINHTFIDFVRTSIQQLEDRGHQVELSGIFYHVGENDMSFVPYRKAAAERLRSIIHQSRQDLQMPGLMWYVSQQPPTDDPRVNAVDVTADLQAVAENDENLILIQAFELPGRAQKLVITTPGIVALGKLMAERYLEADD